MLGKTKGKKMSEEKQDKYCECGNGHSSYFLV